MSLSRGDFLGDYRLLDNRFPSPSRSVFPTTGALNFFVFDGGFLLLQRCDSYSLFNFVWNNRLRKPPWILFYKYLPSAFQFVLFAVLANHSQSESDMSDTLRKSVQDLGLGSDDDPVVLPPEFCSRAAAVNRFSVVVTPVNPRKQNLRALINQMPRVWGLSGSCIGRLLGNGRVQFKFQSEESMNLVLQRGPWSFNDWMISVHRWYPNIGEDEMKIIPFWVRIEGIPTLYLTNAMARFVGGKLGHVIDVDYDENVHQVGSVRVRLAWNYDVPLRFQRNFQFDSDENTIIKFRFERLRNFCTKCGSLQHDVKSCSLSFENDGADPPNDDDDDNDDPSSDDDDGAEREIDGVPDTNAMETNHGTASGVVIPGLQTRVSEKRKFSATESDAFTPPSVFEDTELTAERLRYLHTKFVRDLAQTTGCDDFLQGLAIAGLTTTPYDNHVKKQRREQFETFYNHVEAAEESAVLCQFRNTRVKTESEGSCSADTLDIILDGGAGGPVPPVPI